MATGDGNYRTQEVTVSAQNTFTAWTRLSKATFTINFVETVATFAGTFVGQARRIKRDGTAGTVQDILSTTALTNFPQVGNLPGGVWEVRAGIKTGGYTSGTGIASVSF